MNGVDLKYVDEGSGVPAVFSQGGGCSDLRYSEPQREVFAARHRFVPTAIGSAGPVPGRRTATMPNLPWLLEGDPEGEAVLAWWRDENERVRAEAAGDVERAARLWFELVNNRGAGRSTASPPLFAGCGSTTSPPGGPPPRHRNH